MTEVRKTDFSLTEIMTNHVNLDGSKKKDNKSGGVHGLASIP